MRTHPEVLGAAQRRVLRRLGPVVARRAFYLARGTALALQLGHRRSVDFDWFTAEALEDPLGLARELQDSAPLAVDGTEKGTLHARLFGVRLPSSNTATRFSARPPNGRRARFAWLRSKTWPV